MFTFASKNPARLPSIKNTTAELGWTPTTDMRAALNAIFESYAHSLPSASALLSRDAKRNLRTLTKLATFVLLLRVVEVFWVAAPGSARPVVGLHVSWMDVLMPVGIFGIWFAVFLRLLNRNRLVPRVEESESVMQGEAHVEHG